MIRTLTLLTAALAGVLLADATAAAQTTWTQTAAGTYNWPVAAHWDNGIPNGVTADARLTAALAGNVTVDMFPHTTVNRLDIGDSQFTYTLQSANRYNLTFAPNGDVLPALNMTAGSVAQSLVVELELAGHLTVTQNSTAGTLTFWRGIEQGHGHAVTFDGPGTTYFHENGVITDVGAITKNGTGRLMLELNQSPTGTGPVTVNGGTVELNSSRSFSSDPDFAWAGFFASGRDFTVNSGGALLLNGNWATGNGYANSYTVNGTGRIGGSADFNYINDLMMNGGTIDADGIRTGYYFNASTPTWRLGSGARISSVVDLVNGVGSAGNQAALVIDVTGGSISTVDARIDGVIQNQDGLAGNGDTIGHGTFIKRGAGVLILSGDNTFSGGTTVERGTLSLGHIRALGTGTTTITPTGGDAAVLLGANRPGDVTTPFVVNAGTGTAIIGTTNGGVATGFFAGTITLNGPVTLLAGNTDSSGTRFTGKITGTGDVTIASTAAGRKVVWLPRDSASVPHDFVGNLRLDTDATLHIGNANGNIGNRGIPDGSTVSFLPGSRLQFESEGVGVETVNALHSAAAGAGVIDTVGTTSANQIVLTVGAVNGSGRFDGVIQETARPFALVKTGTGTQTLSGANTYTGGTTVNQGTLLATNTTGSATGTGPVSVAKFDATLGGTGAIGGPVALNSGTVRAGGTDAAAPTRTDVLTLGGGLTFDGSASLASVVGQSGGTASAARVNATGAAFDRNAGGTATDVLTIRLTSDGSLDLSGSTEYTVTVLTYGSLGSGLTPFTDQTNPTHFAVAAENFGFASPPLVTLSGGNLSVTFTPVPEPATVLMIGAAGLGLGGLVRRRAGRGASPRPRSLGTV